MVLTTPGEEEAKTDNLLASVHDELIALRRELEALTKRARAGEEVGGRSDKSKVSELTTLLTTCQKVEANLDTCRRQRSRIAQGGYALDLESARTAVRCALGRLSRCQGSGELSGGA